jgi:hypothetical protein
MRNVFGLVGVFVWAFAEPCNTMVSNLMGQKKGRPGDAGDNQESLLLSIGLCIVGMPAVNCFSGIILWFYLAREKNL